MEKKRSALLFFWIVFLLCLLAGGAYLIVQGVRENMDAAQHVDRAAAFLSALG